MVESNMKYNLNCKDLKTEIDTISCSICKIHKTIWWFFR